MENLIIDIEYNKIDVTEEISDEKYWRWIGPRIHKTKHTNYNSILGSDMQCSNCTRRHNCRTCRDTVSDAVYIDKLALEGIIRRKYDLPINIIDDLIDSKNHICGEYLLVIPSISEFKIKYKNIYDSISTVDLEYLDKFIDILSDADISAMSIEDYERYIYDNIDCKIDNKLHNQFQISFIPAFSSSNGRIDRILEYLRSLRSSMISNMSE